MNNHLFHGQLVRLAAADSETDAETMARWSRDSEFQRLSDSEACVPSSVKQAQEGIVEWMEHEKPNHFEFVLRTLADDRLIGFVGLNGVRWSHGEAFVGIGIGEAELWGKGYGTDAMRVILRFAFMELNLHRVSLDVFEYNERALRFLERAGFVAEVRRRQAVHRDGRRWDVIKLGLLREEWEHAA